MKKLLTASVISAVILMMSFAIGSSALANTYVDSGVSQQPNGGQEPGPAQPFE